MSMMPDLPHEREMRVRVCQFSVQIDFFSARESVRHYTARIPHAQLATMLAMAQEAHEGTGPREFILGFTPERLAFHHLAAVEVKR